MVAHAPIASASEPPLARELALARELCVERDWATEDPLGAGALLVALRRADRLVSIAAALSRLEPLASSAEESLVAARRRGVGSGPAECRLAFRELGLAIGIHAVEALGRHAERVSDRVSGAILRRLPALLRHVDLAAAIDSFWSSEAARRTLLWKEHADINSVMLATSLAPAGYLGEPPG